MMGLLSGCTYQTPCGWCAKWDKKCDKKIGVPTPYQDLFQCEHEWEPTNSGGSYSGVDGKCVNYTTYICKKCGVTKNM